jgi:hypothetical protein
MDNTVTLTLALNISKLRKYEIKFAVPEDVSRKGRQRVAPVRS